MLRTLAFLLTLLMAGTAVGETQSAKQARTKNALNRAGLDWGRAVYVFNTLANAHYYDTAVELLAASPSDGRIGYAIDTDVAYIMVAGSWVALSSAGGFLGTNGGTIGNETNNVWTFTENSENLTLTYASDLVTFASGTSATFVLTPATTITGDLSLNGGAGALTLSGSGDSSIVLTDADTTALVIGAAGALDILGVSTADGLEAINVGGVLNVAGKALTESTAADSTLALTHTLNDTGAVDGSEDFTMIKGTLTVTDDDAWATTRMLDLIVGSTSMLRVSTQGGVTSNGEGIAGGAYSITPTYGADKGIMIVEFDGTALDYTAAKINTVMLYNNRLNATFNVRGGAAVVAMDATGLDIAGGTLTANDDFEIYSSPIHGSGRPMMVGTDVFEFCVTVYFTDVSGSDSFYCGVRQADDQVTAAMGYTEFASIGHVSGAMYTQDEDGADADGTDTWGDTTAKALCTKVAGDGVVSYTNDGAAPTNPGAQTLSDGLLVIPFCQILHDADLAEDTLVQSWEMKPTQP
jgi:hypothetical protein